MNRNRCLLFAALAGTTLACGSDETQNQTGASSPASASSVGSGGDTSSTTVGAGGTGTGGGGGQGGGNPQPCPAATICLDVKAVQAGPVADGRVAVVWYQLDDDGPDPIPVVTADAAFDGTATRVEIPLAEIGLPDEPNLLCARACDDEAMCPCLNDPKVGIGVVLIAADANQDGKLDPMEAFDYYGIGFVTVGYSEKELIPAPMPFDQLFVDGIQQGVRPYRVIDTADTFDDLGFSQDGDVFELTVCSGPTTTAGCDLNEPNLT